MSHSVDASGNSMGGSFAEPAWNCEQIERLYRQALDAVEAVANDLTSASRTLSPNAEPDADSETPPVAHEQIGRTTFAESSTATDEGRPDPTRVIEALLFVGGQPLTAKTISGVLQDEFDAAFIEHAIEQIEDRYARQNRPYTIRRGEGGFRIALRSEFEPLRNRVYGFGPKQVRLSQDVLEILALVAYRQPIARRKIEEIAGRNAGSALRQLVERGLLILNRPDGTPPEEGQYQTSARFLQLFGVSRLEDLPQIEDLNYK